MRAYSALLWIALLWAIANCVYVYLFRDGVGTHRIESAVIALVLVLAPRALRDVGRETPPVELSRQAWSLVGGFIVALWAVIYAPLSSFPLLSDDYVFLDRYQQLGDIGQAGQFFRPMFAFLFWLVASTLPGSTMAFHVVSLALHLTSACLFCVLALRVFRSTGHALVCFAVFLLNPLQLEAVLWVSGLQELLWSCAVLAALVTYTGAQHLSLRRTLFTIVWVAVGLLSKETAVCYVLLIPAVDIVLFRGDRGPRWRLAYGAFAAELLIYLLVRSRVVAMEFEYFVEPSRYLFKQFLALPYRFFVQPWNTTMVDVPLLVSCASAVLAIALLFWTIAIRRTPRGLWVGAFLVVASTAPLDSYFFVREDLSHARYLYFAFGGWGFIVAAFAAAALPRPRALAAATVIFALSAAIALQLNVRPWRVAADVVTLMRANIEHGDAPGERLEEWSARTGHELTFRDSIPYEYGGVGIFINGYNEFVRMHSRPEP